MTPRIQTAAGGSAPPRAAQFIAPVCMAVASMLLFVSRAEAQRIAIEAAKIYTMADDGGLVGGGVIENGVILIQDGLISAVGPANLVQVGGDYERIQAAVATPGLIDAHSVVGIAGLFNVPADQDQNETTDPNQAGLRAIDGFNPNEELLDYLLSMGITTLQTGPGPVNPIAGQAGIFKTSGDSVDSMTVRFPSAMLFTLGERPKGAYGGANKAPTTRMATAGVIREALSDAQAYARKLSEAADGKKPDRDLKKEALAQTLAGELPAIITAHRLDDVMTAIRIGREFGLKLILDGATEAYLAADIIKASGAPVIIHPAMQALDRLETYNSSYESAAILADAGIRIAMQSGYESYVPKTRVVLFEAGVAAANGLGAERALKALTIDAARILGIEASAGSIAPGRRADIALFDGDPFEYTTHVDRVFVNGRAAYVRAP